MQLKNSVEKTVLALLGSSALLQQHCERS